MSAVSGAVLVAATVSSGLAAGAYALYAHTIMPGLSGLDDRTFVTAYAALDRAIINPWFLGGAFVGSLGLSVLAAVTTRGTPAWPWALTAAVAAVVTTVVTVAVHLPLNDALKAATVPGAVVDPSAVRAAFHENRWRAWNLVRVATSLTTVAALAVASVLHRSGR